MAEGNVGQRIPHRSAELHDDKDQRRPCHLKLKAVEGEKHTYCCEREVAYVERSIEGADDGQNVYDRGPGPRRMEHGLQLLHWPHQEKGAKCQETRKRENSDKTGENKRTCIE